MPSGKTRRATAVVLSSSSRTGERKRPRLPLVVAGALALAVIWAASYTSPGRFATAYIFVILNFYIGAISLVALSITVMAGLVSTDRIMLRIGHRVLFQGVHRATAIIAVVALGIHISVKVLNAHAAIGDAVVPFYSPGRSRFIGFGTIAAYLMLLSFWSGLARTRFIGSARRWFWRTLHCSAYLSWLVALAHGLNAGRQAAAWVTVTYAACLIGVALALLVRLYTKFGRYATGVKGPHPLGIDTQTGSLPRIQDTYGPGRIATGSPSGAIVGSPAPYRDEPQYQPGPPPEAEPFEYGRVAEAGGGGYGRVAETGGGGYGRVAEAGGGETAPVGRPDGDYYPTPEWDEPPRDTRPRLRLVANNDTGEIMRSGWNGRTDEYPHPPGHGRPGPYPPAAPGRWSSPRRSRHAADSTDRDDYRAG